MSERIGVATLTWLLGWWGVVLAALVAGVLLRHRNGAAWLVRGREQWRKRPPP